MDILPIMNPHAPFVPPQDAGNVYEYQLCDVRLESEDVDRALQESSPKSAKILKNCWTVANRNRSAQRGFAPAVSPDLNARTEARARLGEDESWREFQGRGRPYLRELNNVLLQPTNFSPPK